MVEVSYDLEKQQELADVSGKSLGTIKPIIKSLQDKKYIRRESGKRYGKWEVLVWEKRINLIMPHISIPHVIGHVPIGAKFVDIWVFAKEGEPYDNNRSN